MRRNYFMKSISIILMLLAMLFSCQPVSEDTDSGNSNSNNTSQGGNNDSDNTGNQNGENTGGGNGVGYIAYSDGTISAEYNSAKTAVGVVIEATGGVATKIVSLTETTAEWSIEEVDTNATSETDGMANLRAIQSIDGWENKYPAFKWCDDYEDESGNSEWYLPAKNELNQLYNVRYYVNTAIKKITTGGGNATVLDTGDYSYYGDYWSSSQCDNSCAWGQGFVAGFQYGSYGKYYETSVRAVRAF